ncbi:DUF2442 domain-containing protein [Synergistaceae bacterium OttesenSCG-928-I11]|nr:DUF2442 domain-containing protein [Synergistaceae bacterium OttesenSCG-928-I11]
METVYSEKIKDSICRSSSPAWVVRDVVPSTDYTMLVTFANGEKRLYDARPLLEKDIYSPLKNAALFMSAKVDGDSIVWNDELDIAPEHLYECSVPIEALRRQKKESVNA